jgi:hypothetical protein
MNDAAGQLLDFTRGFSQVGGLSDFIDVGSGKDQADHQIKGKEIIYHLQRLFIYRLCSRNVGAVQREPYV